MNTSTKRPPSILIAFVCLFSRAIGQSEPEPERYALLAGVTKYEHPSLNGLKFPEDDVTALADLLRGQGYKVDLLLGKAATKAAIEAKLKAFKRRGMNSGVLFVGLSGHGMETTDPTTKSEKSYFCPFDTVMQAVRDAKERIVPGKDGKEIYTADTESLVSIDDVLIALNESKAAHRVIVADCCRDDPARAKNIRVKSFGTSLSTANLPQNTVMIMGCKAKQRSVEHDDWGHGALTKCLLEELRKPTTQTMAEVAIRVEPSVYALVKSVSSRDEQTPNLLITGRAELLFKHAPKYDAQASGSPLSEPQFTNTLSMKMIRLPAGEFLMGSKETKEDLKEMGMSLYEGFDNSDEQPQHRVQISKPFYMGAHEVTLGQFLQYYNADKLSHKTDAEKDGKGGWGYDGSKTEQKPEYLPWNTGWNKPVDQYMNHPVVNVSWNDAVSFCEWLTLKERRSGKIGLDQEYTLPSEAQWEYACRGGSKLSRPFSFGNDGQQLLRYGNVKDEEYAKKFTNPYGDPITGNDGYVFTSPVGSFESNGFGLFDMHGNVWEWCQDVYDAKAYQGRSGVSRDPLSSLEGSNRVNRGGGWGRTPVDCRSANRDRNSPVNRRNDLGFRVSLQSVR